MAELYKKHRPQDLSEIIGNAEVVKSLKGMLSNNEIPHSLLLMGPSGCGKTTIARILRKNLECGKHDFSEINCADFRGIDMVREIRAKMSQSPISGKTRVWVIDESHKLSSDAQNAFLKILEDTPQHVYFMLCTTDPQKLIKAIRTRCTPITVKGLTTTQMKKLLTSVIAKEEMEVSEEVVDKIIENSDGSSRAALVLLDQIRRLEDAEDQLEMIQNVSADAEAVFIARALFNPRTTWIEMGKILTDCEDQEPETIRYSVLGYARSILLKGGKLSDRAYLIIDSFRNNFYDSKKAGLAAACYEIIAGGSK